MPKPSECGYPDTTNTGVPAGTRLTVVNGTVQLDTPGQVYSNKEVRGDIIVSAANVTIEKVKVVGGEGDYYPIRSFGSAPRGLVVRDTEIDMEGFMNGKGIAFDNYTATRVFFHDGSDCAHFGVNVTIQDSLCVSGPDSDDDGWPDSTGFCDGPEHIDGFQSGGGDNIKLLHNTVRNPCDETSAILISANQSPASNVRVENNLMAGGGYTLYCRGPTAPVSNETVTGNRISREFFRRGGRWGPSTGCHNAAVHFGNVWDGAPLSDDGTKKSATSGSAAKRFTRRALAREFGRRYTRRSKSTSLKCKGRSASVVACKVSWIAPSGQTLRRYSGKVVLKQVSANDRRYSLRIRSWNSSCRCSRLIKRTGSF
jgi:hypothetical protein